MGTETSNAIPILPIVPKIFPSVGPALLISVGYIDPAKWAVTVDGGARFGFDLMLVVLAFNCVAILCQYLAARVGLVTGKNLTQICSGEYNRPMCLLLGVQAELSVIILDLSMILGIAQVLNLIFSLDLFTCVLFTAIDIVLFPPFIILLNKSKTNMLLITIAGLVLLFYVFGVLISQPEIPKPEILLSKDRIFPMLRGDGAYSLMSLLGASIIPHNFYLHSTILQKQRQPNVSVGTLCHEHFFAILFFFSCIFLVNYVVMLSAANIFSIPGFAVLTLQDAFSLIDQIYQSPFALFVLSLVLFFSSQVTTLTWNVGGQAVLHDFFEVNPPVWAHRLVVKFLAIIPALYCSWNSGAEGIYQLLLFSQVILAMLLPSSVIPLFRVASSRFIMGAFKISRPVEMLALSAFIGIITLNIMFIVEVLFGDSDLVRSLRWNTSSSLPFSYVFLLLTACTSLGLMLWLAVTPLKSASDRSNIHIQNQEEKLFSERGNNVVNELDDIRYDGDKESMAEEALGKPAMCHSDKQVLEFDLDLPETVIDSNDGSQQSVDGENRTTDITSIEMGAKDEDHDFSLGGLLSGNAVQRTDLVEVVPMKAVGDFTLGGNAVQRTESRQDPVQRSAEEGDVQAPNKDENEADVWSPKESSTVILPTMSISATEGSESFKSTSMKNDDGDSGSLSRISILGRAARRQLAAILDEFWGQLYDLHGQVTKEAKAKGVDVVLGMGSKSTIPSVKVDTTGMEYATKYFSEAGRGSALLSTSRDYDSARQQGMLNSSAPSYEAHIGSSSLSSYLQFLDAYRQSSGSKLLDASERRYKSLRLPSSSGERDYQPATVHGYQIASYLNRISADRTTDALSFPLDPSTSKSVPVVPNYSDSLSYSLRQNGPGPLHLGMQNPTVSSSSRLQAERSYYDPSLAGMNVNYGSDTYPKKYNSLPDISGMKSSAVRDGQWRSPIGPGPSVGRMGYGQTFHSSTISSARAAEVPLPFDELSPPKHYSDPFSLCLVSDLDTRSLWSRQPFEQIRSISSKPQSISHEEALQENITHSGTESTMLQSLRNCIGRLLKLDGSDRLFQQKGGFDEELIGQVAAKERFLYEAESREVGRSSIGDSSHMSSQHKFVTSSRDEVSLPKFLDSSVPHCGESCIWRVDLIVSFGIWCIHQVLEMSLVESRPELWGKYTYVLNRLQGIIEPAFLKARPPISPCFCVQLPVTHPKRSGILLPDGLSLPSLKSGRTQHTSANTLLELIKDVEVEVSRRKGRTGTAAGDVAFPKGKENLVSVLKRYKRRLSSKVPVSPSPS